jgi:predicted PurR-regulated permease PerM
MLITAVKYQASWLVHALRGRRNPLCRTVDRLAAAISALLLAVAVIAMAATLPFGALVHKNLSQRASRAAATTHPVTAVLTTDAQASVGTADTSQTYPQGVALIEWTAPNGSHSAAMNVPLNSARGQSLTIWTDSSGNMVPAPASPASVTWAALFGASGFLLAVLLCCTGLILATQQLARQYALRKWGHEWEVLQRWGTLRQ